MGAYSLYLRGIHPLLFRLNAEQAHRLAQLSLRAAPVWRALGPGPNRDPRLAVDLGQLRLPNPIGLAPGFDKDADVLPALQHLGFGFLAPGAVMSEPRPGNPKPRLGRIVEQQAVLNCMGLPSKGLDHAVTRLRHLTDRRIPIMVDVQGLTPVQILENFVAIQPHADAVQLSLACPNTGDTDRNRDFDGIVWLLKAAAEARTRPLFVKVPHDFHRELRNRLPEFLEACLEAGVDGVVASATRRHASPGLSRASATLSGKPVFRDTLELVREIAAHADDRLVIIASGGVMTGRDAFELLRAGASAIQIYSAFVYRGWLAPHLINGELLQVLEQEGLASLLDLRRPAPTAGGQPPAPTESQ
jgi:dihydroorotate dehydrogenase